MTVETGGRPTGTQRSKETGLAAMFRRYSQGLWCRPLQAADQTKSTCVSGSGRYKATLRVMCQGERGAYSLCFVFVDEEGEEDAVHGNMVLECAHGPDPSPDLAEASFYGVGGPALPALG